MTATMTIRARHRDEPHFLRADDGVPITLIRVRGPAEPTKPPVLLAHGVGMRAEAFRPPVQRSLVDALIDDGWDVWLLNWRGSLDLDPLPWTLDDVAANDHPAAVRHVVEQTGAPRIKALVHCVGSMSFAMAAVTGLLPEVDTIVASGVTLHPVLPRFARVKLHTLRPMLQRGEPYVDAAWGDGPERLTPLITRSAVRLWHTECDNPTCNLASFALGSGNPAPWRHENLDEATHEWLRHEFGRIPMSLYHQLALSDRAGQVVSVTPRPGLRARFADSAPRTDARFVLLTGARNRSFLPASQQATRAFMERHRPGKDVLHVLPGYSHTDLFIGRDAHRDVFPLILNELNSPSGRERDRELRH